MAYDVHAVKICGFSGHVCWRIALSNACKLGYYPYALHGVIPLRHQQLKGTEETLGLLTALIYKPS